jgi:uncharacterized surface protein with fasciclin (FAS1) repeats
MTTRTRPPGRRLLGGLLALGLAAGVTATTTPGASAAGLGNRSLAAVLAQDGNHFDHNWNDFDILDRAVHTVLRAKPHSPVAVLAKGRTRLTAFLPTDRAFRGLVNDLAGRQDRSERQVFKAVAGLGVDNVESVLLYHVVPGARIPYRDALRADGAELPTALPGAQPLKVDVRRVQSRRWVTLVDADPNDRNPAVIVPNINQGNKQIAHGINHVLRPADL